MGNLSAGPKGTRQTLRHMAGFVRSDMGRASPHIRALAVRLVSRCPEKNKLCEIVRVHAFVRDKIRYVRDIRGVETLHTPEKLLEYGSGDCDDKTMLVSALLESIGFKTRLVAVGGMAGMFSHVLAEVYARRRWIPLETTERVKVGWYPKKLKHRMVEPV